MVAPTPLPTSFTPTAQPTPNATFSPTHIMLDHPAEQYVVLFSFLGTATAASVLVTHRLLAYYARVDTPFAMLLVVGVTWFLGFFGILVLLPFDLVSDYYDIARVETMYLWKSVYWSTFILSWIITAVAQEYHASGYFTFRDRLLDSIKTNVKIYLILGIILVVIAAILMFTRGLTVAFFMAAANFYGMSLIIIMMGYGIAEIPLSLWRQADPVRALELQEFRAGAVETRMIDAEDQVAEAHDEVRTFRARLSLNADPDVELVARAEQVLGLAPRPEANNVRGGRRRDVGAATEGEQTINQLAAMHKKLKQALVAAERARWDWDDLLERTLMLEGLLRQRPQVEMSSATPGGDYVEDEEDESYVEGGVVARPALSVRLTKWLRSSCTLRGYTMAYRVLAAVSGVMSIVLLWCAVVSPFSQNLSIFGIMIADADSPVAVWVSAFVPLMYMGMCVYTALFKFPYLDVLTLHGNRQTDAYNMCYNASYMGRLQFSMGVVYFGMLRPQDSHDTAFHQLVGDMETVAFIGANFSKYSPGLVIVFTLASLFSIGDRILDYLGISTRKRPVRGVREHEERIENGRRLIQDARARRERERRRQQRPLPNAGAGYRPVHNELPVNNARFNNMLNQV